MSPLQYAVALGCTTPRRLCDEWMTDYNSAQSAMRRAADHGELRWVSDGVYGLPWNVCLHDEGNGLLTSAGPRGKDGAQ